MLVARRHERVAVEQIGQVYDGAPGKGGVCRQAAVALPDLQEASVGRDAVEPRLERGVQRIGGRVGSHPDETEQRIAHQDVRVDRELRIAPVELREEVVQCFLQTQREQIDESRFELLCKFAIAPVLDFLG